MSDQIDNGGPAFPILPPLGPDGTSATGYPYPYVGMSLRDYFAGQALAGAMADSNVSGDPESLAEAAYTVADAMLAARKVTR